MTQTKTDSWWQGLWRKVRGAGSREWEEIRAQRQPRCPNCARPLLLRTVCFGQEAGKQYWDCSNIPRCSLSLSAEAMPAKPARRSPFAAPAAAT